MLGIKKAILKTLSLEGARKPFEITVCFVNNQKIKELNRKYLRHSGATDVIAFNLGPGSSQETCADIIISADTAVANSRLFKTTPIYELYLYAVHGALHILGYDDKSKRQKRIMQLKSARILSSLA